MKSSNKCVLVKLKIFYAETFDLSESLYTKLNTLTAHHFIR